MVGAPAGLRPREPLRRCRDGPGHRRPRVLDAIRQADVVLLPPSNPVVSIGIILGVPGVRDALRGTSAPVVGVSPLISGAPVRATPMRASRPSGSSRRRPPWRGSTPTSSTAGSSPPRTSPPSRASPAWPCAAGPAHDRCRRSRRHRRCCPRPGGRAAAELTVPLTLTPLAGMPEVRAGADLASLIVAAVAPRASSWPKATCSWSRARSSPRPSASGQSRAPIGTRSSRPRPVGGGRAARRRPGHPHRAGCGRPGDGGGRGGRLEHRRDRPAPPAADDPDAEARALRAAVMERSGCRRLGVVVSDTAGRPWRSGQTDFALGSAGLHVLDDLRGGSDADGRALTVTARAIADELAAAGDLVKGKSDGVPVALVRGATAWVCQDDGPGAAALVRTGPQDWFGYGHAEAVRASLGVVPGSAAAVECGIPPSTPSPSPTAWAGPCEWRSGGSRTSASTWARGICASAPTIPTASGARSPAWRRHCGARVSRRRRQAHDRQRGSPPDHPSLTAVLRRKRPRLFERAGLRLPEVRRGRQ